MRQFGHGLLRKLMLSYSLIFMAIVLVLAVLAYRYIAGVSEKTAQISQSQLAGKMAAQVEDYLGEMKKIAEQVRSDSRIMNVFSSLYRQKSYSNHFEDDILENIEIGSILTSHNGPGMTVWRISVYNQYGDFICSGAPVEPESHVRENLRYFDIQELMDGLSQGEKHLSVLPPQTDRWSGVYAARYVSVLLPITNYYGNEVYGVVEIQQPVEKLELRVALDTLSDMQMFVFGEDGYQLLPEDDAFETVDDSRFSIVRQSVPEYGWTVALVQSKASMRRPYESMLFFLLSGGIILVMMLMIVVYVVSRRISAPIVALSKKVSSFTIGDAPSEWVPAESTDEVRELGTAFSSMLKRLTDSITVEKKAYLQALQSQMNPHFLFNSLSILSGMGIDAGSDQIVDTCDKIAEIMRYSSDTQSSTIGKEIRSLHNYLDLMKLRYEEHFSYEVEMDPSLENIPLPRLVMQPIVENCFEHGFKQIPPPWHIGITAQAQEDGWTVTIADNGAGFDVAQRRELDKKVRLYTENTPENYVDMQIGGLGLANTIIRLDFFGGAKCHIEDNQPCGTVVTIQGRRNV